MELRGGAVYLDDGNDDWVERGERGDDGQQPATGPGGGELGQEEDEVGGQLEADKSLFWFY